MIDPAGVSRTTIAEGALRSALSSGERPKRPNALSASLTFGWRALLKIKHVPEQLFDAVGNPIIFTLLFTYLLGGAIAGSTGAYLQFLIPGILVQTVILITAYTGFNLNTDISKGVSDRFRSLPIWRPSVIVGALLGDVARYALASALVLALGLVLGFRPEGVVGVLLSVALLVVFAFSVSWNHCAPLPEQGVSGSPQFSSVASTGRPSRWMGSAKLSLRESSARTARIPALRSRGSR